MLAALVPEDQGVSQLELAETNARRRASAPGADIGRAFYPLSRTAEASFFDLVVDVVVEKPTREASIVAVHPGDVVMHIGLMDNEGGFDARKVTPREITLTGAYTSTRVDAIAAVKKLYRGACGEPNWREQRPLEAGPRAFDHPQHGRGGAPKIIFRP